MTTPLTPSPTVAAIADDVSRWLDRMHHPQGGYRFAEQAYHDRCGEATTAATGALWELGRIQAMHERDRASLAHQLMGYQDDTGKFHDDALREDDRMDKTHPWAKVDEHLAGACEQALAILGCQPRIENTTSPIYDFAQVDIDKLIPSLDHREVPWGRCHNVAFSLLWYRLRHDCVAAPDERAQRVYELIESEMLNPADGMPGGTDHPMGNRIAGYYMLTFAYLPFGRQMPNPKAAIDLILNATDAKGCVGDKGMCHIWDAVYVLNVVGRQLGWLYRHTEASAAAKRIAGFLLHEHRKADGGFSYHPHISLEHQNFIRATPPIAQSDMQGTLMSLACLNIIDRFCQQQHHTDFLQPWLGRPTRG